MPLGVLASRASSNVKLLILALVHHDWDGTRGSWPTVSRLCRITGLSAPTVRAAMDEAKALGWVRVEPRAGQANLFFMDLPDMSFDQFEAALLEAPKTETLFSAQPEQKQEEPKKDSAGEEFQACLKIWWDGFEQETKIKPLQPSAKDFGQLKRLIKGGVTREQFAQASARFFKDDFARKRGFALGWLCESFQSFILGNAGRPGLGKGTLKSNPVQVRLDSSESD